MSFPFLPSLNPQGQASVSATARNHPVGSAGCGLPVPLPSQSCLSGFKIIEHLSRGPGSLVHPQPCSVCLCFQAISALNPSQQRFWWRRQHQQGQEHEPVAAWKASPSPGRSPCLLSPPFQLSPTVCLWVCGWL